MSSEKSFGCCLDKDLKFNIPCVFFQSPLASFPLSPASNCLILNEKKERGEYIFLTNPFSFPGLLSSSLIQMYFGPHALKFSR